MRTHPTVPRRAATRIPGPPANAGSPAGSRSTRTPTCRRSPCHEARRHPATPPDPRAVIRSPSGGGDGGEDVALRRTAGGDHRGEHGEEDGEHGEDDD